MEIGRANRPGEPIGFTDPGRLEPPTSRPRPTALDKVAEPGPSEGLRLVVTSGDEERKAAGIVSLFQGARITGPPGVEAGHHAEGVVEVPQRVGGRFHWWAS